MPKLTITAPMDYTNTTITIEAEGSDPAETARTLDIAARDYITRVDAARAAQLASEQKAERKPSDVANALAREAKPVPLEACTALDDYRKAIDAIILAQAKRGTTRTITEMANLLGCGADIVEGSLERLAKRHLVTWERQACGHRWWRALSSTLDDAVISYLSTRAEGRNLSDLATELKATLDEMRGALSRTIASGKVHEHEGRYYRTWGTAHMKAIDPTKVTLMFNGKHISDDGIVASHVRVYGKGYSIAEIAQSCALSHAKVATALGRLEKTGFVRYSTTAGRWYRYGE